MDHSLFRGSADAYRNRNEPGVLRRMWLRTVLFLLLITLSSVGAWARDIPVGRSRISHRGGTLRVTVPSPSPTLDPQMAYSSAYLQIFASAYDGLLAYRRATGAKGLEIVPDLAEALPVVSKDGLTWTLRLRSGIRFSNGPKVTVNDVVASFRRLFEIRSPTAESFYGNIVGAKACIKELQTCRLEGLVVDQRSRKITFHLTRPDPDFAQKLAFSHAVILPGDVPRTEFGTLPLPGTGTYIITSYDPSRGMVLERNPYFRVWSNVAQPDGYVDRIEVDFGLTDEAAVTAVERGQYDVMLGEKPQDRYNELGGAFSAQTHIQDLLGYYFLVLNVREPPFTTALVRRIINENIDRRAIAKLYGGGRLATPLCQLIPYGMGVDVKPCPTSTGVETPDAQKIKKAREKLQAAGFDGAPVTLVVASGSVDTNIGLYVLDLLQKLGFRARLRTLSPSSLSGYISNSEHQVAMALTSWYADYPSPSVFLYTLLGCANVHPGLDISTNASGFCDAKFEQAMHSAMSTPDPDKAKQLWRVADDIAMSASPLIPLVQVRYVDFVSKRLGHYRYSLLNHLILSEVWVK